MWVTMLLWFLGAKEGENHGAHPFRRLERRRLAKAACLIDDALAVQSRNRVISGTGGLGDMQIARLIAGRSACNFKHKPKRE
jgi:hypothetical protein